MVPSSVYARHPASPWRAAIARAGLSLALTAMLIAGVMSLVLARLVETPTHRGAWSAMAVAWLTPTALATALASGILAALICSRRQPRSSAVRGLGIYVLAMALLCAASCTSVGWDWTAPAVLAACTAPSVLLASVYLART